MNDTLRMTCPRCATVNPREALYCNKCGEQLQSASIAAPSLIAELALWRQFIGPRADAYLERFRTFRERTQEGFVPTWHWPTFLLIGDAWLWYLYRKMYLHATVFLIGGLLPVFLGAGLVGVIIWNIFAAASANYLYYMHVKLSLAMIEQRAGLDQEARAHLIHDAGGIQPYVWWLGIGMAALKIAFVFGIMDAPVPVTPPSNGSPA